jgi:hypothetical protein
LKSIPNAFLTTPIVYAVNREYQIMVPVTCELVMWVEVGNQCFYDDSNGILRSSSSTHRMSVPMELLDREKHYRIGYRVIRERKPYFTEAEDAAFYESDFRPIESYPIRMYHIADAHNEIDRPVEAGSYFGNDLDLFDEARKHFESEVSVSHDAIEEDRLDIVVRAHDAEQEPDILILICDVREILHAHYSDLIVKIVDESGVLIYEYYASSGCLDTVVGEFDHPFGLTASFMSDQEFHHRAVPP